MQARDTIAFGTFRFDAGSLVLMRDGKHLPLGRRAARLLGAFLSRPGEVLTKAELMDAAWSGVFVEESNLTVQIAQLRAALGRTTDGGEWIDTVAGVGYRFAGQVRKLGPVQQTLAPPTVAVLPFADFGRQREAALGDGIAEDVITALSRFSSLSVVARTSSFRFSGRASDVRKVARSLDVRYVVEGSVRYHGERLRLSVQLIDGVSGSHLWADSLDREVATALSDPDELASCAAAMLQSQVLLAEIGRSHRERADSLEAYDLYLRARRLIQSSRQDDNAKALALYLHALESAPDSVEILSGAAEAIHHRAAVGWQTLPDADKRLALALVRRGLDVSELDATSLGLFGNALWTAGEEDLGEAANLRAVAMNAGSPLALICAGLAMMWAGDLGRAEPLFSRALEVSEGDPDQRFALAGMARLSFMREDLPQALAWARRANAACPGLSAPLWVLVAASALQGDIESARRYLDRYVRVAPGVTISSIRAGQPFRTASVLAPLLKGLRLAGLPEH